MMGGHIFFILSIIGLNGPSRAKPVVPCLTPMWGDIPVTRLHIPPRPEAVVSCGRDDITTQFLNVRDEVEFHLMIESYFY